MFTEEQLRTAWLSLLANTLASEDKSGITIAKIIAELNRPAWVPKDGQVVYFETQDSYAPYEVDYDACREVRPLTPEELGLDGKFERVPLGDTGYLHTDADLQESNNE